MAIPKAAVSRRNGWGADAILAGALFGLLLAVYLATFNAKLQSADEYLDISVAQNVANTGQWSPTSAFPLSPTAQYTAESLHVLLGSFLFRWAGWARVGGVHAIFLLNVWVTALTGAMVFGIGRVQRYSRGAALLAALLYGLGTSAWPLSKSFFRDSLAAFFLVAAFGSFELVFFLRRDRSQFIPWIVTLVLLGLGISSHQSALPVAFLFGLAVMLRAVFSAGDRRAALTGLGLLAAAGVGVMALSALARWPVLAVLQSLLQTAASRMKLGNLVPVQILLALALSPGKGFFFESPALVLAAAGFGLAPRSQAYRTLFYWGTFGALLVFLALYRDSPWWGGPGWGVPHLLPAAPLLALGCLPFFETLRHGRTRAASWLAAALLLASVIFQAAGALGPAADYVPDLETSEAGRLRAVWDFSLAETVQYGQALVNGAPWNVAWVRVYGSVPAGAWALGLGIGGLLVVAALAVRAGLRTEVRPSLAVAGVVALGLAGGILSYSAIQVCAHDPIYSRQNADYGFALDEVQRGATPADAVAAPWAASSGLWAFFTSEAHLRTSWYAFEASKVESSTLQAIHEQNAPELGLAEETRRLLGETLPGEYQRLWLVSDLAAESSSTPLEAWWLSQRYTPLRAAGGAPPSGKLRTSLFALAAPTDDSLQTTDATFGSLFEVKQFGIRSFPLVETAQVDEALLVRLRWRALEAVPRDYGLGLSLLDAGGALRAQTDFQPVNGFRPTSTWRAGELIDDRMGITLPADLQPGEYRLALDVYDGQTLEHLPLKTTSLQILPENRLLLAIFHIAP